MLKLYKNMKIRGDRRLIPIVCLSCGGGISFANKRQSRDSRLIEDMLTLTKGARLFISEYSLPLFKEGADITVSGNPLAIADSGDYAFAERELLANYKSQIEGLIIYRWNRDYPDGVLLDISPEELGLKLFETKDFEGTSHKKITREIYSKNSECFFDKESE